MKGDIEEREKEDTIVETDDPLEKKNGFSISYLYSYASAETIVANGMK